MRIEACNVPAASLLDSDIVAAADYRDAYSAPLRPTGATMVDLFFALFGHHPAWVKRTLIARNYLAARAGLDVPAVSEIMNPEVRASYAVGERIGPWPIFSLTEDELIAGRDNCHLDFRLSILRTLEGGQSRVVVSTICSVHNLGGRLYLALILPFHRWGVRHLLSNAVSAGRI